MPKDDIPPEFSRPGRKYSFRLWVTLCASLGLALLVIASLLTSQDASEEWKYTLGWLNRTALPLSLLLIITFSGCLDLSKIRHKKTLAAIFFLGCAAILAPLLSPYSEEQPWRYQYLLSFCWVIALICFGISFLMLAAGASRFWSWTFCLLGSLALGLCTLEAGLLATSQASDGIRNNSRESRHAIAGETLAESDSWRLKECGTIVETGGRPVRLTHRLMKFDDDLFDVAYGLKENGFRFTPKHESAENDLLVFGCSFSFGHGLRDEETWAWQLAELLGPDWNVHNYAMEGYSANQMLCMLENGMIPQIKGEKRLALFLGIESHLIRNDFFPYTPHYQITESGAAERKGKPRFGFLRKLPKILNGSQIARLVDGIVSGSNQTTDDMKALYLALLRQSGKILEKKYGAELTVLLWPDLEYLKPELDRSGIRAITVSRFLSDWKSSPSSYLLAPPWDGHPGPRATRELADGLAEWIKGMGIDRSRHEGGNPQ